ncbi:MAG: hypothetical protein ACR2GY_14130 [Phycisphaerales bacterium]
MSLGRRGVGHCWLHLFFSTFLCVSVSSAQQTAEPIGHDDLEVMGRLLRLSDEQTAIARALHFEYLNAWQNEVAEEVQAHTRKERDLEQLMMSRDADYLQLYFEELKPHQQAFERFVDDMIQRDAGLYGDIGALLSAEQSLRMRRAVSARQRRAYLPSPVTSGTFTWPEGGTDLLSMAYLADAIPEDHDDSWVVPFEEAYLAAVHELVSIRKRQSDDRAKVIATAHAANYGHSRNPDALRISRRLHARLGEVQSPFHQELIEINRAFLAAVARHVGEDVHADLQDRFRRTSSPIVYPDPGSAAFLFEAALNLTDIDDKQRESILHAQGEFLSKHDELSSRMNETYTDVYREATLGLFEDGYSPWTRLTSLGYQREELNQHQATLLATILLPDQFEMLPAWVANRRRWDRAEDAKWVRAREREIIEKLGDTSLTDVERGELEAILEGLDDLL